MKFTTAYYFMLLYATVMIHPLIPIVSDAWGHAFNEVAHISTVHAKDGTHHLEISLAKSSSGNNTKNANKTEDDVSEHILIKCESNIPGCVLLTIFPLVDKTKILSIFLLLHTPPPKFSCCFI